MITSLIGLMCALDCIARSSSQLCTVGHVAEPILISVAVDLLAADTFLLLLQHCLSCYA